MTALRYYLNIYRGYIDTCFAAATTYRLHFFLLIILDIMFYWSTWLSVDMIYGHVDKIGSWNRDELMFFISLMLTIDHLHMTFISENFWYFPEYIRRGEFDFILLRPAGGVFQVFFRFVRAGSLAIIFVPWGMLYYYAVKLDFSWLSMLLTFFLVFVGFALMVSLEILISTGMFWMVEGYGLNFLRMQFQNLSRWPDFIYGKWIRRIFTVFFPILLVGSAPVRFLIDPHDYAWLVWSVVSMLITWGLIAYLWKRGILKYESASS